MATKVKKYKTISELFNDMPNKTISLSQLKGERIISLSEKKYVTYTLPAREKDKLYQVFAKALKIKKDVIKQTPNRGIFDYHCTDGKKVVVYYNAKVYNDIDECTLTDEIKKLIK